MSLIGYLLTRKKDNAVQERVSELEIILAVERKKHEDNESRLNQSIEKLNNEFNLLRNNEVSRLVSSDIFARESRQLASALSVYARENRFLNTKVVDQANTIEKLNQKISALDLQMSQNIELIDNHKIEIESCRQQLVTFYQKGTMYYQQTLQLAEQFEAKNEELVNIQKEKERVGLIKEEEIATRENIISGLRIEARDRGYYVSSLEEKVQLLTDQVTYYQTQQSQSEREKNGTSLLFQREREALSIRMYEVEMELSDTEKKLNESDTANTELKEKIIHLENEIQALKILSGEKDEALREMTNSVAELKHELKVKCDEVNVLSGLIFQVRNASDKKVQELIAEQGSKFVSLTDQLIQKDRLIDRLNREISSVRATIASDRQAFEDAQQNDMEKLHDEIAKLRVVANDALVQVSFLESEKTSLISVYEEKLGALAASLERLKTELDSALSSLSEASSKLELSQSASQQRLEEARSAAEARHKIEEQLVSSAKEVQKLTLMLQQSARERGDDQRRYTQELHVAGSKSIELTSQLLEKDRIINKLTTEITSLKRRMEEVSTALSEVDASIVSESQNPPEIFSDAAISERYLPLKPDYNESWITVNGNSDGATTQPVSPSFHLTATVLEDTVDISRQNLSFIVHADGEKKNLGTMASDPVHVGNKTATPPLDSLACLKPATGLGLDGPLLTTAAFDTFCSSSFTSKLNHLSANTLEADNSEGDDFADDLFIGTGDLTPMSGD